MLPNLDVIDQTLLEAGLVGQKLCNFYLERYRQLQCLFSSKILKKKIMQEMSRNGPLSNAIKQNECFKQTELLQIV